ncbi:hypothetical protein, unlikely [Trypanosoma congolense IL3000]|uniref:Uncharacterized protein n=1 Tax=Trypanosoma congolense (strain IL3000) TaxID=1068625 RepID=F9WHR3_TRYCI|nr:hypothetical protein, unlikely [Trypanosoma congolense IL3000]
MSQWPGVAVSSLRSAAAQTNSRVWGAMSGLQHFFRSTIGRLFFKKNLLGHRFNEQNFIGSSLAKEFHSFIVIFAAPRCRHRGLNDRWVGIRTLQWRNSRNAPHAGHLVQAEHMFRVPYEGGIHFHRHIIKTNRL